MAELHVIDALREKRPELNGIVGHLERQVSTIARALRISTPPRGCSI